VLLIGRPGYLLGGAAVMRTTVALAAALALGIFTVPLAGDAQQATNLWRVGHLAYAYPTAANDLEAFRHRLRDLGYVERMLKALLGALGFEHVKVVFEEPPKT
jgi:hypothetical protein